MNKPTVSVIVPIYNTAKYLSDCIKSILNQTFSDIELILVNDGSTDNSIDICRKYSDIDHRIKIKEQCNQGVTIARKQGVKMAQGDYILFVDSDDTIPHDSIDALMSATKDNVDIVIGSLTEFTFGQELDVVSYRIRCIMGNIFPGPFGKLFKRELFNDYVFNIPKEIVKGEDMLMNVRIAFNCKNYIQMIPNIVYEYRRHEESCIAKFHTSWFYEGLFYEQLFASVPLAELDRYMPVMLNKALEVWHDFYGYKYHLPKEYKSTKLYLLLNNNINRDNLTINPIDKQLLIRTNLIYRFILINIKRIRRVFNHEL